MVLANLKSMKLLIIFFMVVGVTTAQDFSSIKETTDQYAGLMTVEKLAKTIAKDFSTNEDKVKALFCWLAKNIRYDLEEFYNPNRQTRTTFRYRTPEEKEEKLKAINDNIVRNTLRSRKAVCEGYARTFAEVCTSLGIENEIISGYVRTSSHVIGKPLAEPNHAWNAVKLNNDWVFIDATWGAGAENNGRWYRKFNPYYYNIPKEKHFKTHLPEKSIWKLRIGRMEKEEFYRQPIFSNDFLNSNVDLLSPNSGVLTKNKKGAVEILLAKASDKEIFLGFLGSSTAYKPMVSQQDNNTVVSFIPPQQATSCFLLIDRKVAIQFLIQ